MKRAVRIARGCLPILAFSTGSAFADLPSGSVELKGGRTLSWNVSEADLPPALGIALPSYVTIGAAGVLEPVTIQLSSNYLAFIEQWSLFLYRATDKEKKYPIGVWQGPASSLSKGVSWDGSVKSGPPLRPGETIVAQMFVRDIAGHVDEAQPQTMLVSRYLMKRQKRTLKAATQTRQSRVGVGETPKTQNIPVGDFVWRARTRHKKQDSPLWISGVVMSKKNSSSQLSFAQILPSGAFKFQVETERPILGGVRLVPKAEIPLTIAGADAHFVRVDGATWFENSFIEQGISGSGGEEVIFGKEAVRLEPVGNASAKDVVTLTYADARDDGTLYRDSDGALMLLVNLPVTDVPWGGGSVRNGVSVPMTIRARFPSIGSSMLTLPHTDVDEEKFFLSIRVDGAPPIYLLSAEHFDLNAQQGRVALTEAGLSLVQGASSRAVLEATYLVPSSLADLPIKRPDGGVYLLTGDGAERAVLYGDLSLIPPVEPKLKSKDYGSSSH